MNGHERESGQEIVYAENSVAEAKWLLAPVFTLPVLFVIIGAFIG
jgi:hypothetical protein